MIEDLELWVKGLWLRLRGVVCVVRDLGFSFRIPG